MRACRSTSFCISRRRWSGRGRFAGQAQLGQRNRRIRVLRKKSGSWALPRKLACWPGVMEPCDGVRIGDERRHVGAQGRNG